MKYSLFAFALGASANMLDDAPTKVQRDLATVSNVVQAVAQSITALDNAVQNFQGSNDMQNLNNAASALENVITQGTSAIQGTAALSVNDAISLQGLVGSLETEGQRLVFNLANKKPQIQQANMCDSVRQQSDQLTSNSQNLINAVVGKVPTELQGVAGQFAQAFTDTLRQNSANFAPGNCSNANGQQGGGGGGGFPTTSTFGTSFPTTTGFQSSRPTSFGGSTTPGGFLPPSAPTTGFGTSRPGTGFPTGTSRPPVVTAAAANNAVSFGGFAFMLAAFLA